MSEDKDMAQIRQALFGTRNNSGSFYADIKSVDQNTRKCTVVDDNDMEYQDVLLYAVENTDLKGWAMIPKQKSRVLVSRIGGSNELYVAMFSEIDKVLLTIGDKTTLTIADGKVEVDADKIVFNGGENEGLVQIEKLTEKVNAFIDAFNNHVHSGVIIGVSGGSGAPAVGAPGNSATPTAPAQKLNKSDYENTKITH